MIYPVFVRSAKKERKDPPAPSEKKKKILFFEYVCEQFRQFMVKDVNL